MAVWLLRRARVAESGSFVSAPWLAVIGVVVLGLGVAGYLAVGRIPTLWDWSSRHQLLVPLGAGLLAAAAARGLAHPRLVARGLGLTVGLLIGISAVADTRTLIAYQADWFKQVALMDAARTVPEIEAARHIRVIDQATDFNALAPDVSVLRVQRHVQPGAWRHASPVRRSRPPTEPGGPRHLHRAAGLPHGPVRPDADRSGPSDLLEPTAFPATWTSFGWSRSRRSARHRSTPNSRTSSRSTRARLLPDPEGRAGPSGTPGRPVYSAGHDPRLRRAPSGRRRPLLRRPDRQPARARPERGDHHGLLRGRRHGPPDGLPARGARVRVEGALAGDRGVQPKLRPRRLPDSRAGPLLGGRRGAARCDPGRCRCRRQAVLAALVLVSAGERPQRVAGRPAGDGRPADPGRHPDRRRHRGRLGGRPDGATTRRGRALRLLRRGLDHLPGPAGCRLPRLRGR